MNFTELLNAVDADARHVIIPDSWQQGRTVFGGLTLALAYQAMLPYIARERLLRSINATFVSPIETQKPVSFSAKVLRAGRSVSNILLEVSQGTQVCTLVTATFGQGRTSALQQSSASAPAMKNPKFKVSLPYVRFLMPRFLYWMQLNWQIGGLPYRGKGGTRSGGWLRFRKRACHGTMGIPHLLALLDAWPGAITTHLPKAAPSSTISWMVEPIYPLPQLESKNWYKIVTEIDAARDGYSNEGTRIWLENGQLLAIARQVVAVFG